MIIKQVLADLKAQPVIAWVTILGTALAMFLIMVVVMLNQVKVVDMQPESNRSRMLFVTAVRSHTGEDSNSVWSSSVGTPVIDAVFRPLTTPERVGIFSRWNDEGTVSAQGAPGFTADTRETESEYFRIFDFVFVAGAPFEAADVESHLRKAIISRSVAERLFNSAENAVGKEIELDEKPYTVTGVVKDVSPATDKAYSQVWTVIPESEPDEYALKWGIGDYAVAILAHSGQNLDEIKAEVESNLAKYNAGKANEGITTDLNGGLHPGGICSPVLFQSAARSPRRAPQPHDCLCSASAHSGNKSQLNDPQPPGMARRRDRCTPCVRSHPQQHNTLSIGRKPPHHTCRRSSWTDILLHIRHHAL